MLSFSLFVIEPTPIKLKSRHLNERNRQPKCDINHHENSHERLLSIILRGPAIVKVSQSQLP